MLCSRALNVGVILVGVGLWCGSLGWVLVGLVDGLWLWSGCCEGLDLGFWGLVGGVGCARVPDSANARRYFLQFRVRGSCCCLGQEH